MSTTEHTADHRDDPEVDLEVHGHPSEGTYIKIALILAVVTGIEVVLYYWSIPQERANNTALILLAIIKFVMVAAFFMHLRFDNRLLRRLFVGGIILATLVYIAYLLTLGVFVS